MSGKKLEAPVRIGMIGVGGISHGHARNLLATGRAKITAIMDTDDQRIGRIQEAFPPLKEAAVFKDHKKLLERSDVDAVVICSPHCFHCEQIVDSLAAGKHVLTEKPMVNTIEEAKKVLAAWKKSGLVLSISYQRQFDGKFRYMRDCIARGELGDVLQVSAFNSQGWYEGCKGSWRQCLKISGGGQLNDTGSHIVNMITWVPQLRATEVACYQEYFDCEVDINSVINVKFENGALGSIFIAGRAPGWWEDFSVIGTKGALILRGDRLIQMHNKPYVEKLIQTAHGHSDPDRNLVDVLLGRDEQVVNPVDGLRVIELTEAAWESAKKGGTPVKVKSVAI